MPQRRMWRRPRAKDRVGVCRAISVRSMRLRIRAIVASRAIMQEGRKGMLAMCGERLFGAMLDSGR